MWHITSLLTLKTGLPEYSKTSNSVRLSEEAGRKWFILDIVNDSVWQMLLLCC